MSEHDDRYARSDLPRTTGEFRAAPDISASTAEFKAFVSSQARGEQRNGPPGAWPEQPWVGEPPASGSGRTIAIAVAAIVAVGVIVALVVALA
jgi:hypothetical protein